MPGVDTRQSEGLPWRRRGIFQQELKSLVKLEPCGGGGAGQLLGRQVHWGWEGCLAGPGRG